MEEYGDMPMPQGQFISPRDTYASSIKDLTNPVKELVKLEHALKSIRLDSYGKPKPYGEPLVNDIGVNAILGAVHSLVNQVAVMSDITNEHISMLMIKFSDELILDLMANAKLYGINLEKKYIIRTKVLGLAQNHAFLCLRRAYEGGDKRFWKGSQQDIRTTVVSENSGKSILGKFNPFNSKQ